MRPSTDAWCRLCLILLAACAGPLASGCTPQALRQVDTPRMGKALNNRVAVVYARPYRIKLLGLERLHPFDIRKYERIYLRLVTEGLLQPDAVFVPDEIIRDDLLRIHTAAYLDTLKDKGNLVQYLEAPALRFVPAGLLEDGVLRPFRYATGGTLLAARQALIHGIGINLGGGYHHAMPDRGEGFCIYADMPVAIRVLQAEGKIKRALVIDLDVHQGNGTAVCLADDATTFTFSMHEGDIYPAVKPPSDLDVELDAGTTDAAYLALLRRHLPDVLSRARPDIVFLQAGCDTLQGDPLARLAMTEAGIVERDGIVIDACVEKGIPVVMTLGGGYSDRAWAVQYASVRRTLLRYGREPSTRP